MSKKDILDFSENQLREIFTKLGLKTDEVKNAIGDYIRYREAELSSLSLLSYKELQVLGDEALYSLITDLKDGGDLIKGILRRYSLYLDEKKKIAETYQESKSWDKVITTAVYSDSNSSQEAFIDYVEEIYQTKIKDAKHLKKLTGINEETLEGLEETIINSRRSKYYRKIERLLQEGAKYKDLIKIEPKDYGLSDIHLWSKDIFHKAESGKQESVLYAIAEAFLLKETQYVRPDLRSIAEYLGAPYSVLMDSYNLVNRR